MVYLYHNKRKKGPAAKYNNGLESNNMTDSKHYFSYFSSGMVVIVFFIKVGVDCLNASTFDD